MKTHWLYGLGPNKEIKYKHEIDVETNCNECAHAKVCHFKFDVLCTNYEFGTSEGKGCQGCHHRYTRFDDKDSIPCFHCKFFQPKGIVVIEENGVFTCTDGKILNQDRPETWGATILGMVAEKKLQE
jgi:hypothetical protein